MARHRKNHYHYHNPISLLIEATEIFSWKIGAVVSALGFVLFTHAAKWAVLLESSPNQVINHIANSAIGNGFFIVPLIVFFVTILFARVTYSAYLKQNHYKL